MDLCFQCRIQQPTLQGILLKKAFDRFYRGDSSRARDIDGVGLGLSLAQEIARVHGSELSMEVSAENIVTVRLSYPASVL